MIKRVEKIEELLGCSIKNAEVTNQLYNAVKIYDLFLKKQSHKNTNDKEDNGGCAYCALKEAKYMQYAH